MIKYPEKTVFLFDCVYHAIEDYPLLRDLTFEEDTDECMKYAMMCENMLEKLKTSREIIRSIIGESADEETKSTAGDLFLLCDILLGMESLEKLDVQKNYNLFKEIFPFHEFSNKYVQDHFFTASIPDIREKYIRGLSRMFF